MAYFNGMLDTLDASNLVALHVLIEEGHVTRAARRLGITQSSMSHRLARLRATFQDPLFVRSPRGLLPTPRTRSIAQPLADALHALEAVVVPPRRFDPATSRYTLTLALPDALAPLAPRLIAGLTAEAPLLDLRLTKVVPSLSEALETGEPALALAPSQLVSGPVMTRPLGEVRFGVVGRRGHPALRRAPSTEQWLAYGHVVTRFGNEQTNAIEVALARHRLRRRVALEVPSFLAGLFVLPTSDLLMNAPVQLVQEAATRLRLTTRDAPIRLPRVRVSICWHERFQRDAAHQWARERVFEVARPVFQ
ncbi:MAG: LysR family transcriptional regulator [Polyangiaceae bacterium]